MFNISPSGKDASYVIVNDRGVLSQHQMMLSILHDYYLDEVFIYSLVLTLYSNLDDRIRDPDQLKILIDIEMEHGVLESFKQIIRDKYHSTGPLGLTFNSLVKLCIEIASHLFNPIKSNLDQYLYSVSSIRLPLIFYTIMIDEILPDGARIFIAKK